MRRGKSSHATAQRYLSLECARESVSQRESGAKVNSLTRLSTRRKASRSADYDVRKGSVMVCDEASDEVEEEASVILRDDIVMAAG